MSYPQGFEPITTQRRSEEPPRITLTRQRIRLNPAAQRLMGNDRYAVLLCNRESKHVLVLPCGESDADGRKFSNVGDLHHAHAYRWMRSNGYNDGTYDATPEHGGVVIHPNDWTRL